MKKIFFFVTVSEVLTQIGCAVVNDESFVEAAESLRDIPEVEDWLILTRYSIAFKAAIDTFGASDYAVSLDQFRKMFVKICEAVFSDEEFDFESVRLVELSIPVDDLDEAIRTISEPYELTID